MKKIVHFLKQSLKPIFISKTQQKSIIPQGNIIKTSLAVVIAIMTFLGALALGAAYCIDTASHNWENQLAQEATIQLDPDENGEIEENLNKALRLTKNFPSIQYAEIVSESETEKLLKPWLGDNLDFKALPIPRLIIVHFFKNIRPDFPYIAKTIEQNIKGAKFNNHQIWIEHILHIARISNFIILAILFLVFTALSLTIIFATRAALSTNTHIVEVLHFIGTDSSFIARQFDLHFFQTALRGSFLGGMSAMILFWGVSFWSHYLSKTVEGKQMAALFGSFQFSWLNYLSILFLIAFVSLLTMITSHITILKQLQTIDQNQNNLF